MSREDYDKSVADTKRMAVESAASHPDSAAVQTSAARAFIQAGDYDKGVAYATRAMALAPDDPFPMTTRSMAYYQSKDFPKAAEDARHALDVAPRDPVAGALYMLSKNRVVGGSNMAIPETRAHHGREVFVLPENPRVSRAASRPDDDPEVARYDTEQGRAYVRQIIATERAMRRKDYLTAYGLANAALTTYADSPRVLAARAVSAWNLHDYRTAASDATLVLKKYPKEYPMLEARAAAYNEMGRHAEALLDAEKAVALAPRKARALLERAIAKEGLHDPAGSVLEDFKQAAGMDPRYASDYEQALTRLKPGQARQSATEKSAGKSRLFGHENRTSSGQAGDNSFSPLAILSGLAALVGLVAIGFILIGRA